MNRADLGSNGEPRQYLLMGEDGTYAPCPCGCYIFNRAGAPWQYRCCGCGDVSAVKKGDARHGLEIN